jgi:hypothetical protein
VELKSDWLEICWAYKPNMPRRPLIRTHYYPYHITARSNNREWFYIPQSDFWNILLETLSVEAVASRLRIHALVLMSNHLHLIASSTDGKLDEPMRYLLREVCRKVNKSSDRINHVFGGPYKWSLITNTSYFLHCLKYVYRNPVQAGICERVEDYPYSTINAHENPSLLPFPIYHWKYSGDWIKWGNFKSILDWMNTGYPFGFSDYLKKGLRSSTFHIAKNRNTRKTPDYFWKDLEGIYHSVPYNFEEFSFLNHQK